MTALFAHIAEQRQLAALFLRDFAVGAHQQDVRRDADGAQFLDRMLGRLGLQLACGRNVGHQRQVDVDRLSARQIVADLADGFEERHGLDVADRAADLADDEIKLVIAFEDEILDLVGDVRNDLNGRAEIVAAAFLVDDVLVDAAGGDVVALVGRATGEALVVAKVEVGFGAVIGDEDFAVLIGRHRARIDIEIGIELADAHAVAARLQQRAESRCCNAFAEGGNHAACDEYISRHGIYRLSGLDDSATKK